LFFKSLNPIRRIRELAQELRRTREERDQARRRNEELAHDNQRLEKERQRLEEEIKRLRKELETAQRATRRQAAPFSCGLPKSRPKPPGVSLVRPMARTTGGRFRSMWTKRSPYRLPRSAPPVAGR